MTKQGTWAGLIDKYLKYLENVRSASPHTIRSYRLDLAKAWHNVSEDISENRLLSVLREQQSSWQKYSLATRNRKAASLKSFLNWLYESDILKKELAPHIICPKVPQKIPHFISADEAIAILKSFPQALGKDDLIDKTLFCLLYGCGLRVSEACQLKWKDIDWKKQQLLTTRKGQKEQWVPAPRVTLEALKKLKDQSWSEEFVFGLKPLNPRTAYEIVRNRGIKAHMLKPLHPHALRHSYATHLLSSGADLRVLQELLGHSSLAATQKYTHISTHELARTIESHHPLGSEKKTGT